LLEKIERKIKRMSGRNAEIRKNGNAMKILESKYIAKRKSKIETINGRKKLNEEPMSFQFFEDFSFF
jgi:hypothetical protein